MSDEKDSGKEVDKDAIPRIGAFSVNEQEAIIGGAHNECKDMPNEKVIDIISQWADQTRKFSIILDAALAGKVSVGISATGQLAFGIVDPKCDAAKLINDMIEAEKSRVVGGKD